MTSNKDKDDFELLETSRETALRSAVTILEGLSKAKELRKAYEGGIGVIKDDDANPKGDFLFDLLRLNATYLNEVAKLGERYNGFALRALEKLYAFANPTATRVVLTPASNQGSFTVRNDSNPGSSQVTLDIPAVNDIGAKGHQRWRLRTARGNIALDAAGGVSRERPTRYTGKLDVDFGDSIDVFVEFDFDELRGLRLEDEIRISIELGARRSKVFRVPLVIDNRPPPKAPK